MVFKATHRVTKNILGVQLRRDEHPVRNANGSWSSVLWTPEINNCRQRHGGHQEREEEQAGFGHLRTCGQHTVCSLGAYPTYYRWQSPENGVWPVGNNFCSWLSSTFCCYNKLYEGVDVWMSQAAVEDGCIGDGCSWGFDSVIHRSVELGCFTLDGNISNGLPKTFLKKCAILGLRQYCEATRNMKLASLLTYFFLLAYSARADDALIPL